MTLRRSPRRQSSTNQRSVRVNSYQPSRVVAFACELLQRTRVSRKARSPQHFIVLGLALFGSAPARAAETGTPEVEPEAPIEVVLEYDSPASCSTPSEFQEELRARSPRVVLVENRSSSTLLRVSIRETADGAVGELQLVQGLQPSDSRFVKSHDCANVVQALALTAALSLAPSPDDALAFVEPSEPHAWEVRLGARAEAAKVVESHFGFGGGLWINAERDVNEWWTWWLSFGASFITTRPLATNFPARFELMTAQAWVCPLRFGDAPLSLRPCLNAQLGTLSGRGQNLAEAREASSFWASFGPSLILNYDPSPSFRLDFVAGAAIPVNPQDYTIDAPEVPVSSTVVVAPWFGIGVSYGL